MAMTFVVWEGFVERLMVKTLVKKSFLVSALLVLSESRTKQKVPALSVEG